MARKLILSEFAQHQETRYQEPPPPRAAPKLPGVEPIESVERYANAAAPLSKLKGSLARIESEIDALGIEQQLQRRPDEPRADNMRARLAKLREGTQSEAAPQPGAQQPAVTRTLELLEEGTRPPPRRDIGQAINQLEEDRDLVREAIAAQQPIVDAVRHELSADVAARLRKRHRDLVVEQHRAAQALAAATDSLRDMHAAVAAAGYAWHPEALPEPTLRAALVLGSERDWNSEIRQTGRLLEELKIL